MTPARRQRARCRACLGLALALLGATAGAAPAAEALLRPGEAVGERPRIGVNLGGRTAWGAEQLLGNVLRNPGLEAVLDGALIVAGRVDGALVTDDSPWTARPAGFWRGAAYEVLSGAAAGRRGSVLENARVESAGPDSLRLDAALPGLRAGDVIAVSGAQDPQPAAMWWTEGEVARSDDRRPGSPGAQAVLLRAQPGRPAALHHHLDSIGERAGRLLPVQGRWRLALWLRSGAGGARVAIGFGRRGSAPWVSRELSPGAAWQQLTIEFDGTESGPAAGPSGPLQLSVKVLAGEVRVDDLELGELRPPGATPGGFREAVVQTLRALRPGYLREWQGQLADLPANRFAEPHARRPIRYRPGAHELQFAYSVPELAALAADVGARPWFVLPATTTPGQARTFGAMLAREWQRHRFEEIVVEHGNEHWNAVFRPAGVAAPAVLAEVADRVFAALREGAGPAVPLHRVLGAQYVDGAAAGRLAARSRETDGIAVAPYFLYRLEAGEGREAALDRALREDVAPLLQAAAGTAAQGRALDVYEVNFHTTLGSASPAERDAVVTSSASGTVLARRLLQAAHAGTTRQAVYALAGYDSFTTGPARELVQLWGITRDLSAPARWRPTGLALQALNEVFGGAAQRVQCSGAACGALTSMSFDGGTRWVVASAATGPVSLAWPCRTTQRVRWLDGSAAPPEPGLAMPARMVSCAAGLARFDLPPRSLLTAVEAAAPLSR